MPADPVSPSAPDESALSSQHPSLAPVDAQDPSQPESLQHEPESADTQNPKLTEDGEDAPTVESANTNNDHPQADEPQIDIREEAVSQAAEKISESSEMKEEMEDAGSSLVITLLLTTGARHPFKIDGKYLRKRSVNVDNDDPFTMSVYTLKELIWREWRSDWETRPASPSSIRLISFGKLLEDKSPLSDSKFSSDAPNVVHMTVKPQEMIDEEDGKGGKTQSTREREENERSAGCRCIIL